jgi:hypothetical protein
MALALHFRVSHGIDDLRLTVLFPLVTKLRRSYRYCAGYGWCSWTKQACLSLGERGEVSVSERWVVTQLVRCSRAAGVAVGPMAGAWFEHPGFDPWCVTAGPCVEGAGSPRTLYHPA